MTRRPWSRVGARLAGLAVLMVAIGLGGCDRDPGPAPASSAPATTRPGQPALLTLAEVQALPSAPEGFMELTVSRDQLENIDQRGPCGAKTTPIPGPDAWSSFTAQPAGVSVGHHIYAMPEGRAAQLLAEMRADIRPNCPPFQASTRDGVNTSRFLIWPSS